MIDARISAGIKVIVIALTIVMLVLWTVQLALDWDFASSRPASDAAATAFAPFWEAAALIERQYVDDIDLGMLGKAAIDGMVRALDDDHSAYIASPAACDAATDFSGEFTGIGVMSRMDEDSGAIVVESVIANSPAEAAGVLPGDIFHAVDGVSVAGKSQDDLSALVPGPRGSQVNIEFRRGVDLVSFTITRDVFAVPTVAHRMAADNIAYIRLLDLNDLTREQFDAALMALDVNERNGLVLDLRGNPGGTLSSAIKVASAFVEDGVLVRQASREAPEERTMADGSYLAFQEPVAVLIDETSASAAEVIAGALKAHGVATLIGESTFGKGTVQNIRRLSDESCLRLTIKRWLTPDSIWIHQNGIEPDIAVEGDLPNHDALDSDSQLRAAIEYLKQSDGR